MNVGNNGTCKIIGCRLTTHILGSYFSILKYAVKGVLNQFTVRRQIDVTQQFGAAQEHSGGISYIFTNGFGESVTCTLQKIKEHNKTFFF